MLELIVYTSIDCFFLLKVETINDYSNYFKNVMNNQIIFVTMVASAVLENNQIILGL